jgi:zinc D-Ala-D-Ala carboxypeptidase
VVERLQSIELRMNEIRAKASSFGRHAGGAEFRRVLDNEVATVRSAAASTRAHASDAYSPLHAPEALATWGNGQLPASALDSIGQGNHRLARDAAAAFKSMAASARRDGIVLSVSDSYRSLDEQQSMVETHGHYDEGGFAAEPGTSAHGWGLAVDLDVDTRTLRWMRAHAGQYGFVEDVAREPWHWTFRGTSSRANELKGVR